MEDSETRDQNSEYLRHNLMRRKTVIQGNKLCIFKPLLEQTENSDTYIWTDVKVK